MPVPSKSDVDLKELAVKWRGRLPVWYGDRAKVDVSREVPGEVFLFSVRGISVTRSSPLPARGLKDSEEYPKRHRLRSAGTLQKLCRPV